MVNWQQQLAARQNEIAYNFLDETKEWLNDLYSILLDEITQDFTSVYNQMLSTLGEKEKPSPAHLYKLDSYWELQKNTKALFERNGKEIYFHFNSQLARMYVEVYEGIAPDGREKTCLVDKIKIQELIDSPWGGNQKNVQERIWINLTVLFDNLFGDLMQCVIKNSTITVLKNNLQERCEKSKQLLNTLFSDENTHLRAYATAQRYKDDFKSSESALDYFNSYVNTYGNEEEIEACNVLSEAVTTFSLARAASEDEDENEDELDAKEYYDEETRWEIIGSHGCEPCADLDGLVWEEKDYGPVPVPVHPNCMCDIAPAPLSIFSELAEEVAGRGFNSFGGMVASMVIIAALVTLGVMVGGDQFNSSCATPAEWLEKWGDRYPV